MRKFAVVAASLLALCSTATDAAAQFAPLGGRLLVSVNGGAQVGGVDADRTSTFDLYDEPASLQVRQRIKGGGLLDIGAGTKVWGNFGVGVAYTRTKSTNGATIDGSLPHPLFFDQPRAVSASVDGLDHREHQVHLQALWFVPFVENVDFIVSAGPTIFNTRQGFVRGIGFSEIPPSFNAVTVDSIDIATLDKTSVGFNIGLDATYSITSMLGAGALVRYSRGSVDFDLAEGQTASIKAGNFQIAGGLRVRF